MNNWTEEDEQRMDIVGSNGPTGEHYKRQSIRDMADKALREESGRVLKKAINYGRGGEQNNKYHRQIKGVTVDVYDVLKAFEVTNPALQHLIKKALCCGLRGHKDQAQDLQDIIESAIRAKELDDAK